MPVVTVAAAKGGVGKTTLAYELAAILDGVLIDFDWDLGGATHMWGYDSAAHKRAPLLDALEAGPDGKPPTPRTRPYQPLLVPSHRDLAASAIDESLVADCLASWSAAWTGRVVVADTHPGANPLTDGAVEGADLVVVPVVLGVRELDALEGMLNEFHEYRLLIVPTMVPRLPPRRLFERLKCLVADYPVAPPISDHRWIRRRLRRAALSLQKNPGQQVEEAAAEFRAVAQAVEKQL